MKSKAIFIFNYYNFGWLAHIKENYSPFFKTLFGSQFNNIYLEEEEKEASEQQK